MTPKCGIEKAWLAFGLLVFVAHRMLEVGGDGGTAGGLMLLLELIMVAMTFPLGGVVMFFLALLIESCESCRDLEWTLDWSTLMFVGYLQWFWVVPEIQRRSKLTLLDLSPHRVVETIDCLGLSIAAPKPLSVTTPTSDTGSGSMLEDVQQVSTACVSGRVRRGNDPPADAGGTDCLSHLSYSPTAKVLPHQFDSEGHTPLERVLEL